MHYPPLCDHIIGKIRNVFYSAIITYFGSTVIQARKSKPEEIQLYEGKTKKP